jgi:DNA-binding CsgD family transcriptional regulator
LTDEERRIAYSADITYGTNNEFGFDYLRCGLSCGSRRFRSMNTATKRTARQLECLEMIARGETSAEISDALGISRRTINHYVANTCARLGVRNRTQAVAKTIIEGLIECPGPSTPLKKASAG